MSAMGNKGGGKGGKAAQVTVKGKNGKKKTVTQLGAGDALIGTLNALTGRGTPGFTMGPKVAKSVGGGNGINAAIITKGGKKTPAAQAALTGSGVSVGPSNGSGTKPGNGGGKLVDPDRVPSTPRQRPTGGVATGGGNAGPGGGSGAAAGDEEGLSAAERRRRRGRQSLIIQLLQGVN